jgi:Pvc16 N-terminal domain
MYTALRATSLTLAELLRQRFIADTNLRNLFDARYGGSMIVSLNSPQEMTDNNAEGLSLWLYRVTRDSERLNAPSERISPRQLRKAPLPVCLHYLMVPIVAADNLASPETEQIILGKVLQVFHEHPILRGEDLRDDYGGTSAEWHVRLQALTSEEIFRIYDTLERSYQLSVSYEVTSVDIESSQEPENISPVKVVLPEYGVVVSSEEGGL